MVAVLVLSLILNSTLFVTTPNDTIECYVTIDEDNSKNDTWPDKWSRMELDPKSERCSVPITGDAINWKVLYVTSDRATLQSEWFAANRESATAIAAAILFLTILFMQVTFNFVYFFVNLFKVCKCNQMGCNNK